MSSRKGMTLKEMQDLWSGRTNDEILNSIEDNQVESIMKRGRSRRGDDYVFTCADLDTTDKYLPLLVRNLFITMGLTHSEFDSRWMQFTNEQGLSVSKSKSDRSNMKHAIQERSLSAYNFEVLLSRLGLLVDDIMLVVTDTRVIDQETKCPKRYIIGLEDAMHKRDAYHALMLECKL